MRINQVLALAVIMTLFSTLGSAQIADSADPQDSQHKKPDPEVVEQQKRMEKARNDNRQKELKRDTERLLELATELKQYVDRTNESILSLNVIQKADEIEKLAKSVKNKMKGP